MYYNTSYTNAIGRGAPTYYGKNPAFGSYVDPVTGEIDGGRDHTKLEQRKKRQKAKEGFQMMLGGAGIFVGGFIAYYVYDKFLRAKK